MNRLLSLGILASAIALLGCPAVDLELDPPPPPEHPVAQAASEVHCGNPPEVPWVCADGSDPCECVQHADGTHSWVCDRCYEEGGGGGGGGNTVDCVSDPSHPYCGRDYACVDCHGLLTSPDGVGIENAHPWLYVACVDCHGGLGQDPANPTRRLTKAEAHVPMPVAMRDSPQDPNSLPSRAHYRGRYLGRAGMEFVDGQPGWEGALDWLQFVNPSALQVVDRTCARAGCHIDMGEKVRRSTMSTLTGKLDAMPYAFGIPRVAQIAAEIGDSTAYGKRLATWGALDVHDPAWNLQDSPPGSTPRLAALKTFNRDGLTPVTQYSEIDVLKEIVNKQCGNCHLNNHGANEAYGTFRGAGCAACHMPYDFSGRSQSRDPHINKNEPTYPQAYTQIQYPERPHPVRHTLTRAPQAIHCIQCHMGSARQTLQYMGIRSDDNLDLTRARDGGANIQFQYDREFVDNQRNAEARFYGFRQEQLIRYEDLNEDGQDDTPPDVHWEAGRMQCIDCHTATEMHGDGNIYSRQGHTLKINCIHCHGSLEYPVDPDLATNPINELYHQTGNEARKVLWRFDRTPAYGEVGFGYVTQPGVWMRLKSNGQWRYVSQIAWGVKWDPDSGNCFGEGRQLDPRSGGEVCTPAASIAHGRWQGLSVEAGHFDDGVGPRPGVEVVVSADGTGEPQRGFSHLGDVARAPNEVNSGGLECAACHAVWHGVRHGNHMFLKDTDDDGNRLYDWDRITGERTIGTPDGFNFTYVSNTDLYLGVRSTGKIGWFIPTRVKAFVRARVLDNNQEVELMTRVGDANHVWKTYRDRLGYGNLDYNQGEVTGAPGFNQTCLEDGFCVHDNRKNINPALGMDEMAPHTTRRRARDCTSCHRDATGQGLDLVSAVFGWNPDGYTPETSAYLNKIDQVVANTGVYSTADGYRIEDDGIGRRLDWYVDRQSGFPFAYTLHLRKDDGRDGRPRRGYQTFDSVAAGPVTTTLMDRLERIQVRDLYDD